MNAEDPSTSRLSAVPLPSEPQPEGANTEVEGDEWEDIASVVSAVPVPPKQRQRNDSVSCHSDTFHGSQYSFPRQTKMDTWASFVPFILDELIRRAGLQERLAPPQCVSCLEEPGTYRCVDCTTSRLYCTSCIVFRHEDTPLHRIEVCIYSLKTILSHVWLGLEWELLRENIPQQLRSNPLYWSRKHSLSVIGLQYSNHPCD